LRIRSLADPQADEQRGGRFQESGTFETAASHGFTAHVPHQLAYTHEGRLVVPADRNGQWSPIEDGRPHAPHVLVAEVESLDHVGSRCRHGKLLCG
jgi:hypothetical protein